MRINKKINSNRSIFTARDCPEHHRAQEKHIITIKNINKDKKIQKTRNKAKIDLFITNRTNPDQNHNSKK